MRKAETLPGFAAGALKLMVACAVLCSLAGGGQEPGSLGTPSASSVRDLVRRLRMLKAQEEREREAWEREKQELERLCRLRREELSRLEQQIEELRKRNASLMGEVGKERASLAAVQAEVKRLEDFLGEMHRRFDSVFRERPLLLDPALQKKWKSGLRKDGDFFENAVWFFDFLLTVSRNAVRARITRRPIVLSTGERIVADILRLGGYAAYFLSLDGRRCGRAQAESGRLVWRTLNPQYVPRVKKCAEILRKQAPARLEVLPVERCPAGGRW